MAEIKKYLDTTALGTLVDQIKAEDAKVLESAKGYADSLATNYDASGAAATALSDAKAYADGLAKNYDEAGAAAAVDEKLTAEVNRATQAEADLQSAIDAAQGAAEDAQGEVDALETYVGTIPEGATATDIVGYVQEKTAGIATDTALSELQEAVDAVEGDVATIKGDYLKAADKTELEGKITAEADRAKGIEGGLETRLAAVEGDYLKAADKTELQGNIDTVSGTLADVKADVDAFFADADMTESAKDTLKELQAYIASDESGASAMTASIKQNADDIDALEGRMDTAEGKITTVEGKVSDNETAIAALEEKFGEGEGSVADMIADAVAAEKAEREAADAEVQADADKGIEDAAAALAAANAASAHADELNTAMDTRVKAVEGKAHEHANKDELDLIASGDKAKWDAAADKAHEHENKSVLDGITSDKVTAWDTVTSKAAQSDLDAAVARISANETAIAGKAEDADLDAAVERIAANETAIAANTSAINSFTAITSAEVEALFA